jgi:hypothetical protein
LAIIGWFKLDYCFTVVSYDNLVYLRNKSWKPECVGSFNMDWQIFIVFYPEPDNHVE